MNIVVLDGYALNPGDLSWDGLRNLGDVTVYERTTKEQVIERAIAAEAILTNKTPLSSELLEQLPALRYIGVLATGYNIVDVTVAKHRGIVVTNIPDYSTWSVAQHTIALLLQLSNRIWEHAEAVRMGEWQRSPDWCFTKAPLLELYGKKLGIIGHGKIGQQVGRVAAAMGMKVVCVKRSSSPQTPLYGEAYVDMNELFSEADIISLHCPLTDSTAGLICNDNINRMKNSAMLLNTSRGGLVNERDLAQALNAGRIAGAGLDVLSLEPPEDDNPLLHVRNCIITPHIAWAAKEARARLLETCEDNLRAFLNNSPIHVV